MFEKYGFQKPKIRKMAFLSRGILAVMAVIVGVYIFCRLGGREGIAPDILILGAFALLFPLMKYSRLFLKMSATRFLLDDRSLTKLSPGGKREEIFFEKMESVIQYKNGLLLRGEGHEMVIPSAIEKYDDFVQKIERLMEKKGEEKI